MAIYRKSKIMGVLVVCLLLTIVDFTATLLLTIPCLRSLYARQNNADYSVYVTQTQITALQQQNAELEKQLRILNQDVEILRRITHGKDYVPPKE